MNHYGRRPGPQTPLPSEGSGTLIFLQIQLAAVRQPVSFPAVCWIAVSIQAW